MLRNSSWHQGRESDKPRRAGRPDGATYGGPTMPNAVFEAVRTVLAVRQYQDKEVADDLVRRVVEAGRLTASGSNRQPWHFVVVRDPEALQRLGRLVRTGPYIAGCAFAVVVANESDNPL